MSEPLGLHQVEDEILRLERVLEDCTHAGKRRFIEHAEADTAYDIAYAKAFLLAKEGRLPGQESRASDLAAKAHAVAVCQDELTRRNATHALLESAREAGRNYRAQLEALRSINANVRSLTTQ